MSRDASEADWLEALSWLRVHKIRPSPPETRLPSEEALAKESRFTRSVVRRALQYLVEHDELISKKGSGYYTIYNLNRTVTIGRSMEPSTAVVDDTEVSDFGIRAADEEVGRYLKIRPGEDIVFFRTRRFIHHSDQKRPCLISQNYVRIDKIDIETFSSNLKQYRSVSSAIRHERVSAYLRVFTNISCRFPTHEEREQLRIGALDFLIETRGVNADADKDPIELTVTCWPAHIWTMRFEF
jgi:DNA-binding GntR family transcriptional regulator